MRLPNPNDGKPFDRIIRDNTGEPVYGIRHEHTRDEEIVHLPTNFSNQTYYQPEMIMNPEGCTHVFALTHAGKREVECEKCHFATSFIVGQNVSETPDGLSIVLRGERYPIRYNPHP